MTYWYMHCLQRKAIPRDKNTPIISCGQIGIQMKWNSSLSIETGVHVRAASRLSTQLRSEQWFNIGVNSDIRARYTTDILWYLFETGLETNKNCKLNGGSDTSFTNLWRLLLYIQSLLHYIENAQENKKNTFLAYNIAEDSKRIKKNEEKVCVCVCVCVSGCWMVIG